MKSESDKDFNEEEMKKLIADLPNIICNLENEIENNSSILSDKFH